MHIKAIKKHRLLHRSFSKQAVEGEKQNRKGAGRGVGQIKKIKGLGIVITTFYQERKKEEKKKRLEIAVPSSCTVPSLQE